MIPVPEEEKKELLSKIKLKSAKIDISKSVNEYYVIKLIIEKYGLKESLPFKGKVGFYPNYTVKNYAAEIGKTKVNKIMGMDELSNKSTTSRIISFLQKIEPEEYDFIPKTFRIPQEQRRLKEYWAKYPKLVFISKPADASGGDGIKIFSKYSDLIYSFQNGNYEENVAQVYLSEPLLLKNRKFDMRIYVLIASLDPLIIYINEEALTRFCTQDYSTGKKFSTKDLYRHLTNYCFNKNSKDFVSSEKEEDMGEGSKRPFSQVLTELEKIDGFDRKTVVERIGDIALKTVKALLPFAFRLMNKKSRAFHILGLDIMLDAEFNPWLLEVNSNPSLNICHVDESPERNGPKFNYVDVLVKEKVVRDAIIIALTKKSVQGEIELGQSYNSYRLLEYAEEVEDKGDPTLMLISKLYDSLLGVRDKHCINGLGFEKLLRNPTIECSKVTLQLIFARFSVGSKVNLFGFIRCLEELHSHHSKYEFAEFITKLLA